MSNHRSTERAEPVLSGRLAANAPKTRTTTTISAFELMFHGAGERGLGRKKAKDLQAAPVVVGAAVEPEEDELEEDPDEPELLPESPSEDEDPPELPWGLLLVEL